MVRLGPQPLVARPAWYDRNPAQRVVYTGIVNQAPHTVTQRVSYTVPAGKKAMIECLILMTVRATAATTMGVAIAKWSLTPSGGSEQDFCFTWHADNNVNSKEHMELPSALTLLSGDVLKGYTSDSSTGGTMNYFLIYKITEFDA